MDIASMYAESGSGSQETYVGTWLVSLEANRSISGAPNALTMRLKSDVDIFHSAESRKCRDAMSASMLCLPGMWAAEICMPPILQNSHMFMARSFMIKLCVPPCLLI